jgi:hypothetical protein
MTTAVDGPSLRENMLPYVRAHLVSLSGFSEHRAFGRRKVCAPVVSTHLGDLVEVPDDGKCLRTWGEALGSPAHKNQKK